MITLANVYARGGRGLWGGPALKGVSASLAPGVAAFVGTQRDGTSLLLSVLAGQTRLSSGTVAIDGDRAPEARARVALVPRRPELPGALEVREALCLAGRLRARPGAAEEELSRLGVAFLAGRRVRSLSPGELRCVALALALASSAKVIAIDEPLADLEHPAPSVVAAILRERAAAGVAVVVATASMRDATRLADQIVLMTLGTAAAMPPAHAHITAGGARLRVVVSGSPEALATLLAHLRQRPVVRTVEPIGYGAGLSSATLALEGLDLVALAAALADGVVASNVHVERVESDVLPLDVIRATVVPGRTSAPVPRRAP